MFNKLKIDSVASTNSELKRICSEQQLLSFSTLVAAKQTAGRGQTGTSWESEPYKNLTFSTILFPENLSVKQSFFISRFFALAIKKTLDKYIEHITIKWPNDIYFREKKICGILIENEILGAYVSSSIIGIGLNVNQECFVSNAPNPISMKQITGENYPLDKLLDSILEIAQNKYRQFLSGDLENISTEYHQALYRESGYYNYEDKNGCFQACIKEIKDDGTLILETGNGEIKHYLFKEVRFI